MAEATGAEAEALQAYDKHSLSTLLAGISAGLDAFKEEGSFGGAGGGYTFVTVEQMIAAVRGPLGTAGIVVYPAVRETLYQEHGTTARGTVITKCTVLVDWIFLGPGGQTFTASTPGEAHDSGDKAGNKALTAAFKNLLRTVFMIAKGGEDNDANAPPERAGPAQQARPQAAAPPATDYSADGGYGECDVHPGQYPHLTGEGPNQATVHRDGEAWCYRWRDLRRVVQGELTARESDRSKWPEVIGLAVPPLKNRAPDKYTIQNLLQLQKALMGTTSAPAGADDNNGWG